MTISLLDKTKGFLSLKLVENMASRMKKNDAEGVASIFETMAKIAPARYHRESFRLMAQKIRENDPFARPFFRLVRELDPHCLQKLIQNLFVNFMVIGRGIRDRKEKELGVHLPNFMVISPTMKCNLHCKGCYAAEYDQTYDMSYEELDRILTEGKSLGMYFYTFSGGEVLLHKDILRLWEKHSDCYFQFYTNGTLLDEKTLDRLFSLGNVAPMLSVEGTKEQTDARRGEGIYDQILDAFSRMKRRGMPFGFSTTFTNLNADYIGSEEFVQEMLDFGCSFGWIFQYIPIGLTPDLTYMATPEQRNMLRERVARIRENPDYPILFGDFWNDAPYVDGCMAGGRRYWHIIHNGLVEPCVFAPFAVDNIKEKSIVEIADSPFFKAIQEAQPYDDDNLLRPCMIIDHPEVLRDIIKKFNAVPCHPGLDAMLEGDVAEGLDEYAAGIKKLYDPVWNSYWRQKYWKSLEREDNEYVLGKARKELPVGCSACGRCDGCK